MNCRDMVSGKFGVHRGAITTKFKHIAEDCNAASFIPQRKGSH